MNIIKHYLLKNSFLRGVLFLLLCAIGLGNAWGEEVTVTFDANTNELNWTVGGKQTGVKNGITLSTSDGAYNTNNKDYRIYKGKTFTITCDNGNITKIVVTCSGETNGPKNFSNPTSGTYSYKDKLGTWIGSAQTVTLTASGAQVRMKTIAVTYVLDTSITYSVVDHHDDSGANREYYVGDTPTADGLALIDNSGQEITEGVTWSFEPQTIQEETKSVTASAEYQGVKRAEYTYNITNKGTRTLLSIEIGGEPEKTSYYIGDTPSAEGLTVNAVYSDNSKVDVTDEVTWTFNPETIAEGTRQVTATASYRGEEAEKTFDVTVAAAPIEYTYTLDLTTKTYYEATTTHVYWDANVAELATYRKNSSTTAANNYLGGDSNNSTSSRFYTDNTVTITPKANVTQVVFYTNSDTFAKALLASNYTNATFSREQNSNNIIIKPQNSNNQIAITMAGTCGCTAIKLYYQPINVTLSSAGYATFCLPYNAIVPEGMTAYTATDNGESVKLTAKESNKIAAGEGVILKGKEGTYTFVAAEGNVNATESNQLVGITKDTQLSASDNAYMLTRDKNTNAIAFRRLATSTPYTLSANKAYLKLNGGDESRQLISVTWDDNATSIYELKGEKDVHDGAIYNLAGQKLIHTQKGINIINGKLVIK